jgi:uncharacterized protein YjiK
MRTRSRRSSGTARWIQAAIPLVALAVTHPAIAQSRTPLIRKQTIDARKLGIERPIGLAYRSDAALFVIPGGSTLTLMTPFRGVAGGVPSGVSNPAALAWDARHERLLALEQDARSLRVIPSDGKGGLDPARGSRLEAPRAGLLRAAGMAVDPATGEVFVLDRLSRRVLRFDPAEASSPAGRWITLGAQDSGDLVGLAYDPAKKHLFSIAAGSRALVEFAEDGREVGRQDLAAAGLRDPRGLVLAPSGDQTDDPGATSFFVADAGAPGEHGQLIELTPAPQPAPLATSIAATAAASLVRVTATSAWSPSSPDPSGITYDSINNRLIVVDGEVEEMTIYSGKNAWEVSLSGVVARSWTTFPTFSDEPVGVAFNRNNRHLFISDDDHQRVYDVNPGPDNLYGTSDDTRTFFSTLPFGSGDPEGCGYDPVNNRLFICDGVNEEIYVVLPGPNGVFDGVDDTVTHFDTNKWGVFDPETVEYKEESGTLLTLGRTNKAVVELTATGAFVSSTDVSFAPLDNPAGLALAPSSGDPTKLSYYIVNRAVDNDFDPTENDGTLVEISLSGAAPGTNDYPVLAGADDAEEAASGTMYLSSSDLELVFDGSNQTVGMRFGNVKVPQGATISTAWVQFMVDEAQSEATNLTVQGQAADNVATFTSAGFNLSSRPRTTSSVSWSPVPWSTVGLMGPDQKTPELRSVIQEIVNRPGWAFGNAMGIIIRGTGHRTAVAFEGSTAGRPVLHIELTSGPPTNTAPFVDAGPNRTVALAASASLDGTVTDDGLPNPPAAVNVTWDLSTGPGSVTFQNANAVDTQASFSQVGTYVLRLTATDGALSASDSMTVTVMANPTNTAPVVDAGPDRTVVISASALLDGTVTDDGLPNPPSAVTVTWSVSSGPGTVTFVNANAVDTQVSMSQVGTYVLRLTASDGALSAFDSMTVTVQPPPNTRPVVDAGPNRSVVIPASAVLDGTVTDDGFPNPPAAVTVTWSVASGPGAVIFQDPNAVDTQASFVLAGTYILRLTASDGALFASDSMTVTVRVNTAPVVDAGLNLNVVLPFDVLLDATVGDDGLPSPPAAVAVTWSVASGPGTVTFLNANAVDTRASFGQAGTYVLRLTASDGALSAIDSTTVTVQPAPPPGSSVVERRVAASSDDAEERLGNGAMHLGNTNLQIIRRSKNDQIVGIRLTGLMIPRGVPITKAWIQFTTAAITTTTTSLQLRAQAAGSPPTFSSASANISSRPKTAASIGWTPPAWTVIGEAGSGQRTSDIASVIQEIVNRSDWTPGNPLVILITGTGTRTAAAFEGSSSGAALLHVEY